MMEMNTLQQKPRTSSMSAIIRRQISWRRWSISKDLNQCFTKRTIIIIITIISLSSSSSSSLPSSSYDYDYDHHHLIIIVILSLSLSLSFYHFIILSFYHYHHHILKQEKNFVLRPFSGVTIVVIRLMHARTC